jgi:hypothetical protein
MPCGVGPDAFAGGGERKGSGDHPNGWVENWDWTDPSGRWFVRRFESQWPACAGPWYNFG